MTKHQEVQDSTYFKSSSSSLRIPSAFGLLCDLKISIFSSIFRKWLVYLWDPTWFWILPRFVFFSSSWLTWSSLRTRTSCCASAEKLPWKAASTSWRWAQSPSQWRGFRMSVVEVSGTNKENLSGTYLSVKHPESDKTDNYTVGWISGYLGYRISEVMLRWSHRGRAPEETCVWLVSLAWTAKLCFLVTICVFSQSMETQDMRKVHSLYLFAPYFIDGLKSRQTVQGVGPLWHHKHLTDASPRLVMLILFLSPSQHGRSSEVSLSWHFFCLDVVNRGQTMTINLDSSTDRQISGNIGVMRLYKMDGIWEWLLVVTTLSCPLQTWRKYDIDCSGYISAQELKVSWPPQIKWSLFTQEKQLHSWGGGDLEGVSGRNLQLLLSAPCRPAALELPMDENLSGWN